jgi:hypothetical protein
MAIYTYGLLHTSSSIVRFFFETEDTGSIIVPDGYELYSGSFDIFTSSIAQDETIPYTGSFTGSFTGSLSGSFNDYSGSLGWVYDFPTGSWKTGSFTGSFTGSLSGSFNGWSGSLDQITTGSFTGSFTGSLLGSSSYSVSSSYALTASYSQTSSFVQNIKAGVITSGEWVVDMAFNYTASVAFSSSYLNTNYSLALTPATDVRSFTITSKRTNGFNVNSNSATAMTDDVYWVVVPYNNS